MDTAIVIFSFFYLGVVLILIGLCLFLIMKKHISYSGSGPLPREGQKQRYYFYKYTIYEGTSGKPTDTGSGVMSRTTPMLAFGAIIEFLKEKNPKKEIYISYLKQIL